MWVTRSGETISVDPSWTGRFEHDHSIARVERPDEEGGQRLQVSQSDAVGGVDFVRKPVERALSRHRSGSGPDA